MTDVDRQLEIGVSLEPNTTSGIHVYEYIYIYYKRIYIYNYIYNYIYIIHASLLAYETYAVENSFFASFGHCQPMIDNYMNYVIILSK